MATKKDLQQAQSYSQRRVLTAFVSGIPGGKELEPSNPMRTVVAAIALAILLALGSVIFGLIRPGLPTGWEHNKLLLSQDTGARYVSKNSVLYPVLNTTSARLLIPAADFEIITIDESRIADVQRGPTIGILGAPDELPTSERLVQTGWVSCVIDENQVTALDQQRTTSDVAGGTIAQVDGVNYLVYGSHSYEIPSENNDGLLRLLGMESIAPVDVTASWLALFEPGTPLAPISVDGAGENVTVGSQSLPAGTTVREAGGSDDARLSVIMADGSVAPLSPFAYELYLLGDGPEAIEVSASDTGALPTSNMVLTAVDWPTDIPASVDLSATSACATLDTTGESPVASLTTADDSAALLSSDRDVVIAPTGGALVRAVGTGIPNNGQFALVDGSGTFFPIPDATEDNIAQLGFAIDEIATVPQAWLNLFLTGPSLTVEAAGSPPAAEQLEPGDTIPLSDEPTVTVDSLMTGTTASPTATIDADEACTVGQVIFEAQTPPALAILQAPLANAKATGKGVTVAIVDSGVDSGNAHLEGAVVGGTNLVPDEDGEEGSNPDGSTDIEGHGTAIAGLIAAQRVPESGVVGLAPDAGILSVRVLRSTSQQDIDAGLGARIDRVADGIRYAADEGAQIINVAISDPVDNADLRAAVEYATARGSLIVASAGNRATDPEGTDGPRYPAAYPEVLGVTATNAENIATDDNFHGPQVDVAAPGANILTSATGAGDCTFAVDAASSSFATGYASAAAALVAEQFPDASPAEWKYRLEATATRAQPDYRDDVSGWGLIQPYEALTAVLDGTTRGPDNPSADRVVVDVAAAEPVSVDRIESPLAQTQNIALWIAVIGATVLIVLALVSRLRTALREQQRRA